ncbi:extracellular solute-binding protein [Bacillus nitroreducens]
MKKRLQLLFLLVAVALIAFGCSKEDTKEVTAPSDSKNETEGTFVSKDPLELSIHLHYADKYIFDDEWLVFKEAANKTNVTLKGTASKNATDSNEVFNLMMASGDIPDIVHSSVQNLNQFGAEGAFIPLNDLIEEHAPNIKKAFEENPEAKKYVTSTDGNIYTIPFIRDGNPEKGWYIRYDWLEKLNLEVPETTEDYYNVLKAFKTQDPNGNGKADEIPYASRGGSRGIEYFTDLMYLWGAYDGAFLKDGEIKYGPLEEEYPIAVKNLAKWYKEGLIDQEIFTRGKNSIIELAGNDTLGAAHDWFGSTAGVNALYKDQIQGFAFKPFAPPTNTKGEKFEESLRDPVGSVGWGIAHSNENPVETIKYFDFWFTEEGRTLMNFGVEGDTYTMVDGKPTFTDEILTAGNVADYLKSTYGVQMEIGFKQDFAYEEQWVDPIAFEGMELYEENGYFIDKEDDYPLLSFSPEEQEESNSIRTSIETYIDENLQKWILGASDVEKDYPAFREQLIKMGAEKYLEIQNKAYKR